MMAEPNLSLREVAKRLAQIRRLPKGKIAVPQLLGLLKAGELKAGYEFPGTRVLWIPIPMSYWTAVSREKFGSLRHVAGDKKRTGTYKVRISDFVDEYVRAISQRIEGATSGSITALLDEMKKALSASQEAYEVAITAEEWTTYLKRHQILEPVAQQRSPAGRRELPSWSHLVPLIAAYMMTLDKRPHESHDHDSIAEMILQLANKAGRISERLPAKDTLADVISKIFAKARELSP
jgi:hypothetical protein